MRIFIRHSFFLFLSEFFPLLLLVDPKGHGLKPEIGHKGTKTQSIGFRCRVLIGFRCQVSAQPPAKKTAGLIENETFLARFQNLPLLGFAFRDNTGKM
jgi:hypothetical protein